jgi:hypothetical protein
LSSPLSRLMIRRVCASRVSRLRDQSRDGSGLAPDRQCVRRRVPGSRRNICCPATLVNPGGGVVLCSKIGRSEMSLPDDDNMHDDNVVRLGNDTLFAIADELRRMYDADLRKKPSERLEELMRRIERGEDV